MLPATKPPASALFHRALISLIPAMGLSLTAYKAGFAWYLVVPAIPFWIIGIWYLKRGSDRWKEQQR
jgi:hypothetical protein